MKVEVITEEKVFQPIGIKLVIESEEDLCNLYHRLNVSVKEANQMANESLKFKCNGSSDLLWKEINYLVEIRNLKQ